MGAQGSPFCTTAATTGNAWGRLPFFPHQSATQISIWALSSSSCHTPSITKSTSCLLKHHLERGDGVGMRQEVTGQKSPPPRSLPWGVLYQTRCMMGWALPLASHTPSTIYHQPLGSGYRLIMSLIFVGTGTGVQMEAHIEQGILELPKVRKPGV